MAVVNLTVYALLAELSWRDYTPIIPRHPLDRSPPLHAVVWNLFPGKHELRWLTTRRALRLCYCVPQSAYSTGCSSEEGGDWEVQSRPLADDIQVATESSNCALNDTILQGGTELQIFGLDFIAICSSCFGLAISTELLYVLYQYSTLLIYYTKSLKECIVYCIIL